MTEQQHGLLHLAFLVVHGLASVRGLRREGGGGITVLGALPPRTVEALYVSPTGTYAGLPGVEVWDEARDARRYAGSHPVVAHPPFQRWGRYAYGSPYNIARGIRLKKGDDGGCFAAALEAVRRWGGVLEHPADSSAWDHFGLQRPPRAGGWIAADWPEQNGWTCAVDQGHYGHRAPKATWLYAVGVNPLPSLRWGRSGKQGRIISMGEREREATPVEFRDLLLGMARSVR